MSSTTTFSPEPRLPAAAACPQGAIVQDDIFSAPWINHDLCTECGACANLCRVFSSVADTVAGGPVVVTAGQRKRELEE